MFLKERGFIPLMQELNEYSKWHLDGEESDIQTILRLFSNYLELRGYTYPDFTFNQMVKDNNFSGFCEDYSITYLE